MLKIKLFLILGIVLIFHFVILSAGGITIPPKIIPGSSVSITIDLPQYSPYVYFYKSNPNTLLSTIQLNSNGATCNGKKTFNFLFTISNFSLGDYLIAVYSLDSNSWVYQHFEMSENIPQNIQLNCSDGTSYNQCSLNQPKFCDNGTLTDSASMCGCPENYKKSGNFCLKECSEDKTLYGQCSLNQPKFCDNGTLIDECSLCGCSAEQPVCATTGVCLSTPKIGPNKKSASKYSDKSVFFSSDDDWKNILPFVPVAVWTEGNNVKKYPFLFYRSISPYSFDIQSSISFMQQYTPDQLTIIGETSPSLDNFFVASPPVGAGLQNSKIIRIDPIKDYLNYWDSFNTVVYVEDNYEMALLASTYASLINAPLVIKNGLLDSQTVFFGRKIICMGNVNPSEEGCAEKYNTLGDIQNLYFSKTNTKGLILINPNDWQFSGSNEDYSTYYSYKRTSLIAPILASAKHELIISTTQSAQSDLFKASKEITNLMIPLYHSEYLTIMASGLDIPFREEPKEGALTDFAQSYDFSYATLEWGDGKPVVAVGRISGFDSTDISSYVARDLFYDSFPKTNNAKFLASSFSGILAGRAERTAGIFKEAGYYSVATTTSEDCYEFSPLEWKSQDLIYYQDHGSYSWAGMYSGNIPSLTNSFIVTAACDTVEKSVSSSFWAMAIKQGAIGFIGPVGETFLSDQYDEYLNNIYYSGLSMGDAFKRGYDSSIFNRGDILIGDPTLNLNPTHRLKRTIGEFLFGGNPGCKIEGEWCCSGPWCDWINQQCCTTCSCEGFPFFKKCASACQGIDTSCGKSGECKDCTTQKDNYCRGDDKKHVWQKASVCGKDFWGNPTCNLPDSGGITVEDCSTKPAEDVGCNIWGNEVTAKYYSCSSDFLFNTNGKCGKDFWATTIEKCPQICKDGKCTCGENGVWVVWNSNNCCSGKVNWIGVCSDCLGEGGWAWWNSNNCCSGQINWWGTCK